jgi:serine/threonine protein kinase
MTVNIGTPVYMAPELMTEVGVVGAYKGSLVDVYAFGILMWAIMSRQKPYYAERKQNLNIWRLRDLIIAGTRPEFDDSFFHGAPVGMVLLTQQCWDPDPARRPSGFDQVQHRLGEIIYLVAQEMQEVQGPTIRPRTQPSADDTASASWPKEPSMAREGAEVGSPSSLSSQSNPMFLGPGALGTHLSTHLTAV